MQGTAVTQLNINSASLVASWCMLLMQGFHYFFSTFATTVNLQVQGGEAVPSLSNDNATGWLVIAPPP